jgi:hypothetical protein
MFEPFPPSALWRNIACQKKAVTTSTKLAVSGSFDKEISQREDLFPLRFNEHIPCASYINFTNMKNKKPLGITL